MKKTLLMTACVFAGLTLAAQQNVVKDAEKAMKAGQSYQEVLKMIQPAMTDAETANEAITYYIPGKAGYKQYDEMFTVSSLGRLPKEDEVVMAEALLGGFDNFMKALPLDTVVNAKGKVKTKYSKEILNTVGGHYNDFTRAGAIFFNAKDYKNAVKAWDIYAQMTTNPERYKVPQQMIQPDTVLAENIYYLALSNYFADDKPQAARLFKRSTELNPNNPDAWKNGLISADNVNDSELLVYFAEGGEKLFGKEDSEYTSRLINYYISSKQYDKAVENLEKAISKNPGNAQYYVLKGAIKEESGDFESAMDLYRKALEIDAENGPANFQYGRGIYLKADKMSNGFDGSPAAYNAFKEKELKPLFLESVKYLEQAYKFDPNNKNMALTLLNQLYYELNDADGMKSVNDRKLNDD